MGTQKRKVTDPEPSQREAQRRRLSPAKAQPTPSDGTKRSASKSVQIITGSYDRVLRGVIATIPDWSAEGCIQLEQVSFNDNFLLDAHTSAIRCLAITPPSRSKEVLDEQKIILASGGTDEKINLYHLSNSLPPSFHSKTSSSSDLDSKLKLENPKNKELGALLHHSSNVNVLCFPTRRTLLSGAEDNTIAISRTSDWTVLSTIKAPIPRAVGRPSGDTAPPGEMPAGINDFAVHPSLKTMISVGKGEKCMRLWNLVTGKKAGVLNFDRDLLRSVDESKFSSGEGRKAIWNGEGNEFIIGFDRGAVLFSMDCKPKGRIIASPASKLHQMRYLTLPESRKEFFVTSTEDGRVLFYCLEDDYRSAEVPDDSTETLPTYRVFRELGGKKTDQKGRIKDFEILPWSDGSNSFLIVTVSSDGSIRVWRLAEDEFGDAHIPNDSLSNGSQASKQTRTAAGTPKQPIGESVKRQVGRSIGQYTTQDRITCLKAYVLLEPAHWAGSDAKGIDSASEFEGLDSDSE